MGELRISLLGDRTVVMPAQTWSERAKRAAWDRFRRWAWGTLRKAWTHRRRLAPIYLFVVLQVAGLVLNVLPDGWKTATALVAIGGGLTAWYDWRGKRKRWHRIYTWCTYTACSLWLIAAAAWQAGPPMPGVLAVITLSSGTVWWWRHRIRSNPTVEEDVRIWNEHIGSENGFLRDSYLTPTS